MRSVKTILVIAIAVWILAACGTGAPSATTSATNTLNPKGTSREIPTIASTPLPKDVAIYWNTFEDVSDPAASGITPDKDYIRVKTSTENVDYPAGGKQALEVSGTLPGEKDSSLSINFSVKKLIAKDILDLTNKTIGFSAFIPKDSPLGYPYIFLNKGDIFVSLPAVLQVSDPQADALKQGVWVDYQSNVGKVYRDKSWGWTNGSEAQAMDVIQNCESFFIGSARTAAGNAGEAKFYLDDLNWIGIDINNVPVDNNIDSLRKYAANQHFQLGMFTQDTRIFGDAGPDTGDPWYAYMDVQEGTINAMGGSASKQTEDYGNFNWDPTLDARVIRQIQFGKTNHLTDMGYGIGAWYGSSIPQWLRDLSFPDATKAFMLYHIEKDLRYTKGLNPVWLLFNEFMFGPPSDNGGAGLKNRQAPLPFDYSPWAANRKDSSLFKAVFIKARGVDPNAILLLNDYDNEDIGWTTSDFEYQFVSGLKEEGIPIDGVGFELHNFIDPNGKLALWRKLISPLIYSNNTFMDMETFLQNVDLNVKRYASAGLKVAFTEVEGQIKIDDIDLHTPAGRVEYDKRLKWQAKYYAGLLKIALENNNVILYHMWGLTDRFPGVTVWPGFGDSWIFDKHYNPKPAYYAMMDVLKNH